MAIKLKRVYEPPSKDDGYRVLVDRLWPRGMTKEAAAVDLWLQRVAPTPGLRTWYGHEPSRWPEFRERYRAELADHEELLELILDLERQQKVVTLLYATKDDEHNSAAVVAEVLGERSRRSTAVTVDEYIARFPRDTQDALQEMRELIGGVAPGASETISYAIPTFDLNGRHLVHFAGFEKHIGFYPTPSGMEAFEAELSEYKRAKGSVRFPLGRPLPAELIRRMVEFRVDEELHRGPRSGAGGHAEGSAGG